MPRIVFILATSLLIKVFTFAEEPAGMQVYPSGNVFPFMGYSGVPTRDRIHGFTVAGPDYGLKFRDDPAPRKARLAQLRKAGLPMPGYLGIEMHFHDKEKYRKYSEAEIRTKIKNQVAELVDDPLVCWWYLGPEEIRYWRKNEIDYLRIASETIRAADPKKRPIWMYEPNHRTGPSLTETGKYLDIIGKGSYVNLAGFGRDRIWVRWSVEQELAAIEQLSKLDKRERFALVMPELCKDPEDPADDHHIPAWVRHDIYLGLITGAKGVAIWSLFRRAGVNRTWPIWYQAYASAADELCGDANLGRVFLFGKEVSKKTVSVSQSRGPKTLPLFVGDRTKLELGTITEEERKGSEFNYAPLSFRVLNYEGATYLFLCNSHAEEVISARINFPKSEKPLYFPEEKPVRISNPGVFEARLKPLEVRVFRLDPADEITRVK